MQNTIIENMRLEMNVPKIRSGISVRVGDICTRTVHFTLANRGSVIDLKNALTAQIHIEKPDGNACYNDCVIAGNEIQYTITSQTINVTGICKCNVSVVFDDGAVLISPEFEITVYEPKVNPNLIESQNEFTALYKQVALAKEYADSADKSAENAAISEENAKKSEEAAGESEVSAAASAEAAAESAEQAKESEEEASLSANSANASAGNARASASEAAESASEANASAGDARESASDARTSAEAARSSADAAAVSATEAKESEKALGESEANAKKSEEAARASASEAAASAEQARQSEAGVSESASRASASAESAGISADEASASAEQAKISETNASLSENAAANSEDNAAVSAKTATDKANEAAGSADVASIKADEASAYATEAESWAHGATGTRPNENIDNARYYYEQSKAISESFSGALRPMGTVTFEELPTLENAVDGVMYNISNQFTTNNLFKEGSGNIIPAGANVYKTSDGYWDVLAGSPVTGIKGNAESSYRRGNVNITAENIGALPDTIKYAASKTIGGAAVSADSLNVIAIANGSDLNAITTAGFYKCTTSNEAAKLKNSPTGNAFFMMTGVHAGIYQEVIEYLTDVPKRFFRNYYAHSDTWGTWKRVYTTADKPTKSDVGLENVDNTADASKNVASANKVNSAKLTNEDLNSLKNGATMYYAGGGNTCTNKPSGIGNFGMIVFQSAAGWYTQILYGSDDNIYTRRYESDTWTSWKRVANEAELDTHRGDSTMHITSAERTKWDGYAAKISAIEKKIAALGYPVSAE